MLVWISLVVGITVIVVGVLVAVRVDRRWRSAHLQCCRCLEVWFGQDKMCSRCGARGQEYDRMARKVAGFPTHDWQGDLDTGPIPVVVVPPDAPIGIPAQRFDSPPMPVNKVT